MYSAECGEGCFANARNGHSVNCQLPISPNRRSQIQMDGFRVNRAVSLLRRTCIVFADGPSAISELFGCGITVGELHNFSVFVERGD